MGVAEKSLARSSTVVRSGGGNRALYLFSAALNGVHVASTSFFLFFVVLRCCRRAFLNAGSIMAANTRKHPTCALFAKPSELRRRPCLRRLAMSVWLPRTQHQQAIRLASISQRARFASTLALRRHQIAAHPRIFVAARFESTAAQSTPQDPKPSPPAPKEDAPLVSRAWKKVKHEAQHYWHGTKLLVSEVRISSRLQWKILHGESLTRRERRQVNPIHVSWIDD